MKTPKPLLVLALAVVPATALVLAPRATASDPTGPAAPAWDGKLDPLMQTLQSGQQKIGRALDKKEVAVVLAQALEMQKAAQEAKLLSPPKAADIKDAVQKAEFVTAFRVQMIDLQKALLDLETAVLGDKLDDAKKIFEERVKGAKKDAHAKFKD